MKIQTIVFEGLYNTDSWYEFDTDCVMISPHLIWSDNAGNSGSIDLMVEDYIIDLDCGLGRDKDDDIWRMPKDELMKEFEEAKKNGSSGEPGRQWQYWKRTIEFSVDDELKHWVELERVFE